MTGILVTRFKMGQINVEDLEQMSSDTSKVERCSAAKKVLEAIRDSPDLPEHLVTSNTLKASLKALPASLHQPS
jgi:hypothetical protein